MDRGQRRLPIGFHITMRLEDDRPIATVPAANRALARIVLSNGDQHGLLGFGLADNHLHTEVATDRPSAGIFARNVELSLKWNLRLPVRFERARIRPLHDQQHAYNTFHYLHRQASRHGLEGDGVGEVLSVHTLEGTTLFDLLGPRVLETSLIARVRSLLPRVRRAELVRHFPAEVFAQHDAGDRDLEVLADAAAAALALPNLDSRSADASRARRAAVHAMSRDVPSDVLSDGLGIGVRAIQLLRASPREVPLVRAVQMQVALRRATATTP